MRNANRACTLETMAVSNANKEAVVSSALRHSAERESYFKGIKIEINKQNKHVLTNAI